MGTKHEPGAFDCYAAAGDDEAMFVLLGRDRIGGAMVRMWAATREAMGGEPAAKIAEAYACADAMDAHCRSLGKAPLGVAEIMGIIARASAERDGRPCWQRECPHRDGGRAMCAHQLCPQTPIGGRARK